MAKEINSNEMEVKPVVKNASPVTMTLYGRRIDLIGNVALIMDAGDTHIVDKFQAQDAAHLIEQIHGYFTSRGTSPVVAEEAKSTYAESEILGILRRQDTCQGTRKGAWHSVDLLNDNFFARHPDHNRLEFSTTLMQLFLDNKIILDMYTGTVRLQDVPDEL